MKKIIFYLTLIFVIEINYGQKSDYISDTNKCREANKDQCTSISINSKGYECCKRTQKSYYHYRPQASTTDKEECSLFYSQFLSQSMMRQNEVMSIEEYGFHGLFFYDLLNISIEITCNSSSSYYDLANYNYTDKEKQILKSPNHCLYYFYNTSKTNGQNKTSITKDICFNAETLDITKKENIYCSYYEYTITFEDKSKTETKTCYLVPSENFKFGKLDSTSEESLYYVVDSQKNKTGKNVTNYEVKISNKNGETILYNINGDNVFNFCYSINFSKIILFGLFLLI